MTVAAPSTNGTRTTSRPAAPRLSQRPPSALDLIRSTDRAVEAPAPTSAPEAPQAQPSGFSPEQLAALSAPLDRANVRQREQGRSKVHYLEGWQVIAEANRIFGFDGWQRQTIAVRCVAQAERLIGARGTSREQKPGWGVTYTARVRVTVTAGGLTPLVREGSGAGHGIDADLGQAHESALKEAETDAMKRALMTFGNPFGLALYDKAQRQVSSAGSQGDGGQRPGGQRSSLSRPEAGSPAAAVASPAQRRTQLTDPTPPPSAQADCGQIPLDTETIQHLHSTLRTLPRPLLESLTRAFRKRFQVPEAAATIADRINQKCHHDWIETFLVSHRELRSTSQHQRQPGTAAQPLS